MYRLSFVYSGQPHFGNIVADQLLVNKGKKTVKHISKCVKCDMNAYHSVSLPDTHCPRHDIDCNQ